MVTRDLSNKRVTLALGPANGLVNFQRALLAELRLFVNASEATRWDGFDLGMQESDQTDDRSLADDAGATIRGFAQFGGGVPFFYPKKSDTGSILRRVFNLVKTPRTELIVWERVGWVDNSVELAAGDCINLYRVQTDGFTPDTEGDGGYAYILNMLPKGDVLPWYVVPAETPVAPTLVGGSETIAGTENGAALRGLTYQGQDITARATWVSSDDSVATVRAGVIRFIKEGTATITPSYPGAAVIATPITVTVAAA